MRYSLDAIGFKPNNHTAILDIPAKKSATHLLSVAQFLDQGASLLPVEGDAAKSKAEAKVVVVMTVGNVVVPSFVAPATEASSVVDDKEREMNYEDPSQAEGEQEDDDEDKEDADITLTDSSVPAWTEPTHISPQTADVEAEDENKYAKAEEDE
ncbi:hypothetical protein L6452_02268 [Arctium lappa]|uniref:Uncharacterized protein n=1 Tax=Arctium lappa TaxID=4217 RepID=A0ACB9FJ55_ARCLA|nr:hypothetical protein L6452_02268 [Arctium lappa]